MKNYNLETDKKITSGFKVPENFFDSFSENLTQQLPANEVKVISFYARNKKWIYAAAAIVVLSLSLPIVYHMENNEEQLSASEIENYLTQQSSISEDEIVNMLEQEDIAKLKLNSTIPKEAIEEELTNTTDLEKYITN
jgi:phage terminase small subunit